MSFSDEAVPAEEATPEPEAEGRAGAGPAGKQAEPGLDAGIWSEADAAAVAAEAKAGAGAKARDDDVVEGEIVEPAVSEPEVFALDPVQQLESERDEYLLALQRTQADFENYRKRIQRMQDEQSARAASDLVMKLLTVLDTLDLAQAHQQGSGAAGASEDAKALQAARSMLLDTLAKEGLERLDEAEVPFDPEFHDAVAKIEGDGGEPVIDEVLRSGYRWRGRVLRPAMVRVRG